VQDEKEIPLERQDDPLAEAVHAGDPPTFSVSERWDDGSQEKWASQANFLQRLSENAPLEAFDVDRDVWKLRHAPSLP
jgi:hypothetical protein